MDIFEVLHKIMEKKVDFIQMGSNEREAICMAEFDVSRELHIPMVEIQKFCRN